MILCPKCQRPMEPNHKCFVVSQNVAQQESRSLQAILNKIADTLQDQLAYLRNLERRVEKLEKRMRKVSKEVSDAV
jgi:hypothetical protein